MQTNTQIPTTVINGFLGSGKTTIILSLVYYLIAKKRKVVYIKNEIGDSDLDAKLIQGKDIISKELLNGCICCTLVGPFISAIEEVIKTYHPDRIIIESSGAADPASIALMVENHPLLFRDGVAVVIDVVNFNGFAKLDQVAKRQAEFTDLIIFNKVELADLARKQQVVGYIRELNENAPIVEALDGKINPDLIFGIAEADLSDLGLVHDHDHNQDHSQQDQIDGFTYKSDKEFDEAKLLDFLRTLPKNILRVKGVIKTPAGIKVLNGVFNRFNLTLPPKDHFSANEIIFIGFKAKENEQKIRLDLDNLD